MPLSFQVTMDCANAHEQADWWAETLSWDVVWPDEKFIQSMIDQGHATDAAIKTHRGHLVWAEAAAIVHPDGPDAADSGRMYFQQVPEAKTAKNRLHLDVRVGAGEMEAAQERLVQRGATLLRRDSQGPHQYIVMTDPEGNEFCMT
ncbi:MAG TPA: VOC family protein [Streptosporangiaceae bacterium]|jgi:hypothetical protein